MKNEQYELRIVLNNSDRTYVFTKYKREKITSDKENILTRISCQSNLNVSL